MGLFMDNFWGDRRRKRFGSKSWSTTSYTVGLYRSGGADVLSGKSDKTQAEVGTAVQGKV